MMPLTENIHMTDVTAIIPARGGSERVPRKNLQEIEGESLVSIAVRQARATPSIDHVVVNSDDPTIRDVGEQSGAAVMGRPDEFTHDTTTQEVDRLLQWSVEDLEAQGHEISVLVLLYPTVPLRTVATIEEAVTLVADGVYDSVLSVHEDHSYLWEVTDGIATPTNYDPRRRGPTQQEAWNQWVENLAVYAVDRDLFMQTGCRVCGTVGTVEMPRWRSVDIDTPVDLHLARLLAADPPPSDP